MAIPRRLNSGNRFERSQNRDVKRVVFLSVEGNVTEPQYFGYVKAFQKELGIKSVVELHVLQRQDTSSSPFKVQTSVYKGYKQDKIEMRGDRAEMSDFPLYLNTVAGGLDRRDQTIGGFSFVVKIYAVPVIEIIG